MTTPLVITTATTPPTVAPAIMPALLLLSDADAAKLDK